jgi:hypothetical protein
MNRRSKKMPGWLVLFLIFAAYLAVMRWMLPAMGIQT